MNTRYIFNRDNQTFFCSTKNTIRYIKPRVKKRNLCTVHVLATREKRAPESSDRKKLLNLKVTRLFNFGTLRYLNLFSISSWTIRFTILPVCSSPFLPFLFLPLLFLAPSSSSFLRHLPLARFTLGLPTFQFICFWIFLYIIQLVLSWMLFVLPSEVFKPDVLNRFFLVFSATYTLQVPNVTKHKLTFQVGISILHSCFPRIACACGRWYIC